ncbi:MAG: peptidylprolyl isomerase [Myxococcota bacterium]
MHQVKIVVSAVVLAAVGCKSRPPEPESVAQAEKPAEPAVVATPAATTPAATASAAPAVGESAPAGAAAATPSASAAAAPAGSASAAPAAKPVVIPPGHHKVLAKPTQPVQASPDDPLKGVFTLADAIKDLPAKGKFIADIKTSAGKLECELYDDRAPLTVANFIGLARGLRPFKNPSGEWVKKPAYDGTTFHRIIKGFMIQGGDPAGSGAGEPGYVIPDEVWEDAYHSERGLLCMANRGPNTNGMQFFIMDGSSPHLDGGYTIFGKCTPGSVIEKLASSEVAGDRAVNPPKIEKVTIRRVPAKK